MIGITLCNLVVQDEAFAALATDCLFYNKTLHADVRVIAATNRDVEEEVKAGRFRSDLYYRLAVLPIHVLPLRERKGDLSQLTMFFLARYAKQFARNLESASQETMSILMNYAWPGNVRELPNVIEREVVLSEGPVLRLGPNLLPVAREGLRGAAEETPSEADPAAPRTQDSSQEFLSLDESQKRHILLALEKTGGVIDAPRARRIWDFTPTRCAAA